MSLLQGSILWLDACGVGAGAMLYVCEWLHMGLTLSFGLQESPKNPKHMSCLFKMQLKEQRH